MHNVFLPKVQECGVGKLLNEMLDLRDNMYMSTMHCYQVHHTEKSHVAVKPFSPDFLKLAYPSLNLDTSIVAIGFSHSSIIERQTV